ncbi:hypothetical protein MHBO_002213 [Bonamia ostreae]|uniref:Uncharacterized protein n=1 Tax=Bonamia ostreae TaxID=126728 RepID=A0ABV2ALK7_9EUKA
MMLKLDPRNNSAWNHRFYSLKNSKNLTIKDIESELNFSFENISAVPDNESVWNYFYGILEDNITVIKENKDLAEKAKNIILEIIKTCNKFQTEFINKNNEIEDESETKRSIRYILSFLTEIFALNFNFISKNETETVLIFIKFSLFYIFRD